MPGATPRAACGSSTGCSTTTTTTGSSAPRLTGGKHEGDWELVQLRLDEHGTPVKAVYSQHKTAESPHVGRDAPAGHHHPACVRRPRLTRQLLLHRLALHRHVVRPGRRQGPADHAHTRTGHRRQPPAWLFWPGRWGETKPPAPAAGLQQPDQPRPARPLAGPVQAQRRRAQAGAAAARAPPQNDRPTRRHAYLKSRLRGAERRPTRSSSPRAPKGSDDPAVTTPSSSTAPLGRTRPHRRRPRAPTSGRASSPPTAARPRASEHGERPRAVCPPGAATAS